MKVKGIKNLLLLLFLATLILGLMFIPYIIFNIPMVYGTDLKPQWFFFYTEFKNLIYNFINTKTLPFYSWNLFLGNNFFASKSYYLMGDIYAYIGLMFKNINFFDLNLILEILKYYISAITMYYLLKEFKYKDKVLIIGALAYAFSGWSIFFGGQMVFLSFYSLLPIYFIGVERYLKKNKRALFILSTTLLLLNSYYFFYTTSLFTILYFTYRYYVINETFKSFWKSAFKLIGYYIIGALMSSILIYPSFIYITSSDRIRENFSLFSLYPLKSYLNMVIGSFIPNYLYIYRQNIFETGNHVTREICLYGSSVIAILIPQFLKDKNDKYKKITLILYLTLLFMMSFPFFGFILHGFSDPSLRWLMFIVLINIIVSGRVLDKVDLIDKKLLFKTSIVISTILVLYLPFSSLITNQFSELINGNFNIQVLVFIIFAFLYFILYLVITKHKNVLNILIILLTLELGLSGFSIFYTSMNKGETGSYKFIDKVTHVLQEKDNDLNKFLDNIEPVNPVQFYRVFVPHDSIYWSYSHNMSVMYQLKGVMTYDSSYSPSINELKRKMYEIREFDSEWIFNIENDDLLDFLSVKYAIVTNESELPQGGNYRLISNDYRGLLIYRNDDYLDIGNTYSRIGTYDSFKASSLDSVVFVKEEDYLEIEKMLGNDNSFIENIKYDGNTFTGYIYSEDDSFMVLSIPFDKGWNVMINGESVKFYEVNGGFIGFKVYSNDNNIEMYFTPEGFKTGTIMSFIGVILFVLQTIFEYRKQTR